jgi:SAM-dependent methyltransferase
MSLFDSLYSIGIVRKTLWRMWYPFLTKQLRDDEVLFLNYAFESDPPMGIVLDPQDEPHRTCVQLYHHVATQVDLRGKSLLEISCGHGGGASYLTRTLRPARYTGLDLNPAGVKFCQKRHSVDGLSFVQGDAEKLPFADGAFDAVINIEASHCYPDFPRFLAEVARVLKSGGHFLYADFRFEEGGEGKAFAAWEQAMASSPLTRLQSRVINDEVRRGMELNAPRSETLIARHLPKFLHGAGRDFAGVPGSRVYKALVRGEFSYRSHCFVKA